MKRQWRYGLRKVDYILMAIQELGGTHSPVCIFDLTLRVWEMNKEAFGLPGYRSQHPDHKAVSALIQCLLSRVICGRYLTARCIERPRPNTVKLTAVGMEQLERIPAGQRPRRQQHQVDLGYIG